MQTFSEGAKRTPNGKYEYVQFPPYKHNEELLMKLEVYIARKSAIWSPLENTKNSFFKNGYENAQAYIKKLREEPEIISASTIERMYECIQKENI